MRTELVLTRDEARTLVAGSAVALAHILGPDDPELASLVHGEAHVAVEDFERDLPLAAHAVLVGLLRAHGYSTEVDEELDGVLSWAVSSAL